jgi:hypothetical protein
MRSGGPPARRAPRGAARLRRPRLVHWVGRAPGWAGGAAAGALAAGAAVGLLAALGLPPERQAELAGSIVVYAQARARGQGRVFAAALAGWLRAAAPVWLAGMWPGLGVPLVLAALALHAASLGFVLGVAAAAGGWAGLAAGLGAVLPGNLFALPAVWWLGARALHQAAGRAGRRPPSGYLLAGAAVLAAVSLSAAAETALAPPLLRLIGVR